MQHLITTNPHPLPTMLNNRPPLGREGARNVQSQTLLLSYLTWLYLPIRTPGPLKYVMDSEEHCVKIRVSAWYREVQGTRVKRLKA